MNLILYFITILTVNINIMNSTTSKSHEGVAEIMALIWLGIILISCLVGCYYSVKCRLWSKINPT
jgi:hypothetical protein